MGQILCAESYVCSSEQMGILCASECKLYEFKGLQTFSAKSQRVSMYFRLCLAVVARKQ